MEEKYKVVSLFSGAMGLDLGMHQTGRFEILACVEIEEAFCNTIRVNKAAGRLPESLHVVQADIANLTVPEFLTITGIDPKDVDIVIGGPPCQAFSTAGRRKGVQDPRGTLLWDFLRFVRELQPRFFLMENVRGLLSSAIRHRPISERPEKGGPPLAEDEVSGSVIRMFADDLLTGIGSHYHMDCFEVNAVNYGAPQLRERALFIGNRYGTNIDFPEPTHGVKPSTPELFDQTKPLKPWSTLGDALEGLVDPGEIIMDFSERKKGFLSLVPPGSNWRSLSENVQKVSMGKAWEAKGGRSGWWRRLTFDLPCPTLVTMPNHASTSLCHPTETRALTLLEYARIQGFPDEWCFEGRTSAQYAQVGNAVPIRLGEVAGDVIAGAMDELREQDWPVSPDTHTEYRVVYLQAHVRTRQWFKNGKTLVWSDGGTNADAEYGEAKTKRRSRALS